MEVVYRGFDFRCSFLDVKGGVLPIVGVVFVLLTVLVFAVTAAFRP